MFNKDVISGMSVVIKGKENPFGVLSVHTTYRRVFNNDESSFLNSIGNIISIAIERKKAEAELRSSVKEKELLLKEIHHRVKNNLQVISSLLNLQSRSVNDPEAIEIFNESQNRIRSMALIHEKLYKSKNLFKINFGEYVSDLVGNLLDSHRYDSRYIMHSIDVNEIYISVDNAVALGLIINELASNIFKHAFKGINLSDELPGELSISMNNPIRNNYRLIVKDNGSGFPADIDYKNTSTLGLQLVNTLVEQLDGKIELNNKNRAQFVITFSTKGLTQS